MHPEIDLSIGVFVRESSCEEVSHWSDSISMMLMGLIPGFLLHDETQTAVRVLSYESGVELFGYLTTCRWVSQSRGVTVNLV